ncbi:putative endo-beta-1,4-glucanase D [Colletotrichum trifolii]|uniref:lytic cellulose monooxygenase (C4-dehydrogenating) n=1 Tax=Colletotrichum trifolii TaxID=5466 RepID=A0A4R8RGW0_COLTR|nr:putative endo-beta-1,4-glucanase D [Colletotrichum trifolii]
MQFLTFALAMASVANAHTMLSEIYINGKSQGDATCIRTPKDGNTATSPVAGLTSEAMACGKDGANAVSYVCPAPGSSKLTFEWREWPDARQEGSIDSSHRGPVAVYAKKVDDIFKTSAAGEGWFKIYEDGYNNETGKWGVDNLIANNGLLSVEIPSGLPAGYYLFRPEILALHQAVSLKDPQYYVGCAQIYIEDGPSGSLDIPSEYSVSIPGYIDGSEVGNNWNLYDKKSNPSDAYPVPGPKVYSPTGTSSGTKALAAADIKGAVPANCLIKNANWCGVPLESYSSETGCWAQVDACYAQGEKCFDAAPPTGAKNCEAWNSGMCKVVEAACRSKNFNGPPEPQLKEVTTPVPGDIPAAENLGFIGSGASSNAGSGSGSGSAASSASPSKVVATSAAAAASSVAAAPIAPTPIPEYAAEKPTTSAAASSAAAVKPSAASSAPAAPSPTGGLKVSTDGTCGGSTGFTCEGSEFGPCCSSSGKCGKKIVQCACGCQTAFGLCLDKYQKNKGGKN